MVLAGFCPKIARHAAKALAGTMLAMLFCSDADAQGSRPQYWLQDFAQLKRELSSHYANLEWAVADRHVDLKQLSERTEAALRRIHNDSEARETIEAFLSAFGDGHLNIEWRQEPGGGASAASPPARVEPVPLCRRLGYQSQDPPPGSASLG